MRPGLIARLRERGVLRVAASYAVIAWLLRQIADVTFVGVPKWVMTSLIVAAVGFPVAIALADVSAHYRYVVDAYWCAAQGRFEDAAAALAKG